MQKKQALKPWGILPGGKMKKRAKADENGEVMLGPNEKFLAQVILKSAAKENRGLTRNSHAEKFIAFW